MEVESSSFIFGSLYGGTAVALIAVIVNQMRHAQGQMGLKNRTYDAFPDSAHPRLTASGVVSTSRGAMFRHAFLALALSLLLF